MSSFMEMSLDDIIQKKKKVVGKIHRVNKINKQFQPNNLPVTDARNKIILKKRTQITDAREKLAELAKQRDARIKLERLRQSRGRTIQNDGNILQPHGKMPRFISNRDRVFADRTRQVVSQPLNQANVILRRQIRTKRYIDNRPIQPRFEANKKLPLIKPIVRTIENDIEIIDDDPMDEEYVPVKPSFKNRTASMQFKIVAQNEEPQYTRSLTIQRNTLNEKERSPPRPPSILKKRPMAALKLESKDPKPDRAEYRIIVSNLRNTVTGSDIEELFGDVGGMVESRLVRPGTAEVIYKTQEDAQRAVDLYHNRQLDGQPMNCLLVAPRASNANPRIASSSGLISSNSNVEPDISTFHKVLFSKM